MACSFFFVFAALFFQRYRSHRELHSFPTRRSSDLTRRQMVVRIGASFPRRRIFAPTAGTTWCWSKNPRSEEHTSELQSRVDLVCRLLLEKKKSVSTEEVVEGEQVKVVMVPVGESRL